jgi:hypothetical protein
VSAYQLHQDGDCGDSCPVCAQECDVCGNYFDHCTCPTLPIEEIS